MNNDCLPFKKRLKIVNEFEVILEDVVKTSEHKEEAEKLLEQVRRGKSWIITHCSPEQYLIDNPLNE